MNTELARKYVKKNHLVVLEGDYGSMDLFYPYLLMDVAYQIFSTDIKPIPCKTEMKKCKNRLAESYNHYWKSLFSVFTQEESASIVELMDGYADFVNTQVAQLTVAAMNVIVKKIPEFNHQKVLSACFVSAVLAHCANVINEMIFKNRLGEDAKNPHITAVERLTQQYSDHYIERYTNFRDCVYVGSDEMVGKVVDSLIAKVAKFPELLNAKQNEK